jgi:His/Glu/Gln/Arg/opine family amino acid ABC transporter permease subunit
MGPLLLHGLLITIGVSCAAMAIGFCGGMIAGIFTCKRLSNCFSPIINGYVLFVRATPVYVQLLLVYYALPELFGVNLVPVWAGIVALSICSAAYATEIVRGGINAVPLGQWEAACALGYSKWHTLQYIIMPQAITKVFPALVNEALSVLKDSSMLSAIGVVELTKIAINMSARTLNPAIAYGLVTLLYVGITVLITIIARYTEKKLEVIT